jgi:transcriptional regulator with XRE-family HTH domain
MLSLEQVLEKLRDRNLTKVAKGSGLSPTTVHKIFKGQSVDVSYQSVKKLSDYLEATP